MREKKREVSRMFQLKEIRMENGLTRAELARALNLNQGTLANYENETREASYEVLIALAEYFDVSVDELLGREREAASNRLKSPLTALEKQLVSEFRELDDDRKKLLREFLRLLAESKR